MLCKRAVQTLSDGSAIDTLSISFAAPAKPSANSPESTFVESLTQLFGYRRQFGRRQQLLLRGQRSGLEWKRRGAFIYRAGSHSGWHEHELCCDSKVELSGLGFGLPRLSRRNATDALPNRIRANDRSWCSLTPACAAAHGSTRCEFRPCELLLSLPVRRTVPTTIHSANTIGWDSLGATSLVYSGKAVRIMEGKGRGQERSIASNNPTTLTVSPAWSVEPDATSIFAITSHPGSSLP